MNMDRIDILGPERGNGDRRHQYVSMVSSFCFRVQSDRECLNVVFFFIALFLLVIPAVAKIATGQVVVATELFDDVLALLAKNVALNECTKVQVAKYIISLECGGWGGGGRGD
jgi:hypothetical protein